MASGSISNSNSLNCIRYGRGKLEVLDQSKLPQEITYVKIEDPTTAWSHLIQNKLVRSPRAITIVAVLSFAVECATLIKHPEVLQQWTYSIVGLYVEKTLDFLVASQPTTVDLSVAATKLKEIASNAIASGRDRFDVMEACIRAAEDMLGEDIASCAAIGSHGAKFLQSQRKNLMKLSVLTHINIDSLATAKYGSALGIIPALQKLGLLKKVYYVETNPFDQVSMLQEKIPCDTPISESAAAFALMKAARVSFVIVGADRVAANGDVVNKIGTYWLALRAKIYNIPFYVAAPVVSIALSSSTGQEFNLETENPTTDLTPANLIAAIITDKGVFPKNGATFDIKGFIDNASGGN